MMTNEERAYQTALVWAAIDRAKVDDACTWAWMALVQGKTVEVYLSDIWSRIPNLGRLRQSWADDVEAYATRYLETLGCVVADGSVRLRQAEGGAK